MAGGPDWCNAAILAGVNGIAASVSAPAVVESATDIVTRFRSAASPTAFRLACYLSAAWLNLPVMRLVQRVMLPESDTAHLAEVFLGGLLRRCDLPGPRVDPELVQYEFVDGVRDALNNYLVRDDLLTVLSQTSEFITERFGQTLDFAALLADPEGAPLPALAGGTGVPLAHVAASVLAKLGGRYRALVDRLPALAHVDTLRYTADHAWVRMVDEHTIRIGISDHYLDLLGDIVFLGLPSVSTPVAPGVRVAEVESTLTVAEVYSPVTGVIVSVNQEVDAEPELINTDPYSRGWLVEITCLDVSELDSLLSPTEYVALTAAEEPTQTSVPESPSLDIFATEDLPDPARSRAVLIGYDKYPKADLPPVPQVFEDLSLFEAVLIHPDLVGLHANQCDLLFNAEPDAVLRRLEQAANEAEDLLLICFMGHGISGEDTTRLLLRKDSEPPGFSLLDVKHIANVIAKTPARATAIIVDLGPNGALATTIGATDPEFRGVVSKPPSQLYAELVSRAYEGDGLVRRLTDTMVAGIPDRGPALTISELAARLAPLLVWNASGDFNLTRNVADGDPADPPMRWLDRFFETGDPEALDRAISGLESILETPARAARSVAALGIALWNRYQHTGDRADVSRAIELMRAAYRELPSGELGQPQRASLQLYLAEAFAVLGEPHLDDALAAAKLAVTEHRALALLHPDDYRSLLSQSLATLGACFAAVGDHGSAIQVLSEEIAISESIYGPDHPVVLASLENLASVFELSGRHDDAIPFLERVLATRQRVSGVDDLRTLDTANRLARAYLSSEDQFDEAITLFGQVLADRERVLGEDHLDTLSTADDLAEAYLMAGRLDGALPLREQNLARYRRVLDADDPRTMAAAENLARAYKSAGWDDQAISLLEKTLADRQRVQGPDHPETLASVHAFAKALPDDRLDQSIALLEQVMADRRRVLGVGHADTLSSAKDLAHTYEYAGRLEEAVTLLEQFLADRRRILGADHPDTVAAARDLAMAYDAAGRSDRAIELLEEILVGQRQVLGEDHPDTSAAASALALAYESSGRWAEAAELTRSLRPPGRIVLCYSPADEKPAHNLQGALRSAGLEKVDLLSAHGPDAQIQKAIKSGAVVLMLLSSGSVKERGQLQPKISDVLDALEAQPNSAVPLITVLLEECDLPERLTRWPSFDLFRPDGYARLHSILARL